MPRFGPAPLQIDEFVVRKERPASGAWPQALLTQEWLVTNGLGGYAAGTIGGMATRGYHGLLTSAFDSPLGRWMMLNHLSEALRQPHGVFVAFGDPTQVAGPRAERNASHLLEFTLEAGLPVWRYDVEGVVVEKRVYLPHRQNSVYVTYRLLAGDEPAHLELRPSVHFRRTNAAVGDLGAQQYSMAWAGDRYELSRGPDVPPLRLRLDGPKSRFVLDDERLDDILYPVEESRGYEASGALWSPGCFRVALTREQAVTLIGSTESWEAILSLSAEEALWAERRRRDDLIAAAHPAARVGRAAQLVLAADQFVITPAGRVEDAARAHAAGDEVRSVIAGYHWFTDWGRDTMISLEGLTLTTGRVVECGYVLRTFHDYIRDGLIPNMFPEGEKHGLYHTADATLWFFHAIDRFLEVTGDRATLRRLLPDLCRIIEHHVRGTRFGIAVDPQDGLLRQGQDGYQLTWMDAKVDDWVVTPRRGKAVEINALWYNALRLLEGWLREEEREEAARLVAEHAARVHDAFNRRFWYEEGGYLYDVVDGEQGDDPACRPNQVFAMSLRHPVLDASRWKAVLQVVSDRLLTPVGLRSLAPGHADYKRRYDGDLRARDAAYHQGTVWPWLIGPFIDAWLKVHPDDRAGARCFLDAILEDLQESCIGSISEVFDAEEPFTPGGCVAQAWSVAEALRCWAKTAAEPGSGDALERADTVMTGSASDSTLERSHSWHMPLP